MTPTARIIDGRAHAERLKAKVAEGVRAFVSEGAKPPRLEVILVGDDPASQVYVRSKEAAAAAAGMKSATRRLPAGTSREALVGLVRALSADDGIDGILVQLPLPPPHDPLEVIGALDPAKDVDGLSVVNAGRLITGLPALVPCTPLGCMRLIEDAAPVIAGRRAVVVGRSNLMGKPMAHLLLQADCTVTIAHSRTLDLPGACREADILVAAAGRPEMIRGDWIKPGAVVIDVGINRVPAADPERRAAGKTRLVGDVAFDEALRVASALTPVPGGVGPMTIACLLENTLRAARLRRTA